MCPHVTPQALDEPGMGLPRAYTLLVLKCVAHRVDSAILPKGLPWSLVTSWLTTMAGRTDGNTSPGLTTCRSTTERRVVPAPSRRQRPESLAPGTMPRRCRLQPPSIA